MTNATWTIRSSWTEGGPNGRRRKVLDILAITSGDVLLSTFTAVEFGLQKIEECSNIYVEDVSTTDALMYPATPTLAGDALVVNGVGTGALTEAVASVTIATGKYIQVTLKGY